MLKRFNFAQLHILTAILLLLKWTIAHGIPYTYVFTPSIIAIGIPVVFTLILLSVMLYFKYKHGLKLRWMMESSTDIMREFKRLKHEGYNSEEIKVMMGYARGE